MKNGKSRYQILTEIKEKKLFNQLVYSGIISFTIAIWYDIFEMYQNNKKTLSKSDSILETSNYFDTSERNIYRIINYMEA